MEELAKSWSCLTLLNVEGSQVSITEEEAIPEFVLAAKFLTKRVLNVETIAKTFTPIWRMKNYQFIFEQGLWQKRFVALLVW